MVKVRPCPLSRMPARNIEHLPELEAPFITVEKGLSGPPHNPEPKGIVRDIVLF